jgi:hypothetical protein
MCLRVKQYGTLKYVKESRVTKYAKVEGELFGKRKAVSGRRMGAIKENGGDYDQRILNIRMKIS